MLTALSDRLASRLSRITSTGRFIPELDGMRFVAIFLVVVCHLADVLWSAAPAKAPRATIEWFNTLGLTGVLLFFTIGGFILALPFASQHLKNTHPVNLRAYFLRRLTRLEPPYLLSLVLIFAWVVWVERNSLAGLLPHLGASFLYLHSVLFRTASTVNRAAWSLEIEVQFYILVPVLTLVFAIGGKWRRRAVMAGAALAAMIFQVVINKVGPVPTPLTILGQLQFFLLGFLLAAVYLIEWREAPAQRWR